MSNSQTPSSPFLHTATSLQQLILHQDVLSRILSFGLDIYSLKFTCGDLFQLLGGDPSLLHADSLREILKNLHLPRIVMQIAMYGNDEQMELAVSEIQRLFQQKSRIISNTQIEIEVEWPTHTLEEYEKDPQHSLKSDRNYLERVRFLKLLKYFDTSVVQTISNVQNPSSQLNSPSNPINPSIEETYSEMEKTILQEFFDVKFLEKEDDQHHNNRISPPASYYFAHFESQLRIHSSKINRRIVNSSSEKYETTITLENHLLNWRNRNSLNDDLVKKKSLNACQIFDKFILHLQFIPFLTDRIPPLHDLYIHPNAQSSINLPNLFGENHVNDFHGKKKYEFNYRYMYGRDVFTVTRLVKHVMYYIFKEYLVLKMERDAVIDLKQVYEKEELQHIQTLLKASSNDEKNPSIDTNISNSSNFLLCHYFTIENNVIKAFRKSVLNGNVSSLPIPPKKAPIASILSNSNTRQPIEQSERISFFKNWLTLLSLESMTDRMRVLVAIQFVKVAFESDMKSLSSPEALRNLANALKTDISDPISYGIQTKSRNISI
nr:unnamed protein product [Naegleria fowleri]